MKLLTRLREEFTSVDQDMSGRDVEQEVVYVSEHAPDALALMNMIEQRKDLNEVA